MSNFRLSRRHVLRGTGLGAVAIALPPLEAMFGTHREAHAGGGGIPARMVIFTFPFGTMLETWTPGAAGTGWAVPSPLSALSDRMDEIAVLTGLSTVEISTGALDAAGHNACPPALLTGLTPLWEDTVGPDADKYSQTAVSAAGPSVDYVCGQAIGATTKVPNLMVATHANASSEVLPLSWSGPNSPTAVFSDPRVLFDFLFADLEIDPEAAAKLAARRSSVLDYVMEDVARLKQKLGTGDQARLDEHLTSLEELESSANAIVSAQCEIPPVPGAVGEFDGDPNGQVRAELLMDLAVMAMQCDLTRSLVFALGNGGANPQFPWVSSTSSHTLSHWNNIGDPVDYAAVGGFMVSEFARLLDGMDAMGQGDGSSLLDHAALALTSELGDGASHTGEALPVVVAGRIGNSLGGQHHVFPYDTSSFIHANHPTVDTLCAGSGPGRPIADLWRTMLEAVGAGDESFGDSTSTIDGLWV